MQKTVRVSTFSNLSHFDLVHGFVISKCLRVGLSGWWVPNVCGRVRACVSVCVCVCGDWPWVFFIDVYVCG